MNLLRKGKNSSGSVLLSQSLAQRRGRCTPNITPPIFLGGVFRPAWLVWGADGLFQCVVCDGDFVSQAYCESVDWAVLLCSVFVATVVLFRDVLAH